MGHLVNLSYYSVLFKRLLGLYGTFNRSRSRRVMILPLVSLVVFGVGAVIITTYDLLMHLRGVREQYATRMAIWEEALLAQNVLGTWLLTGAIAGRIWLVGRRAPDKDSQSRYGQVIFALIESGLCHSLTMAVYLILVLTQNVSPALPCF